MLTLPENLDLGKEEYSIWALKPLVVLELALRLSAAILKAV